MTEQERKAVERLTNEAYPGPCQMHEQPLQRSLDAALLARAFIANSDAVAAERLRCAELARRHGAANVALLIEQGAEP